MGPKRKPKPKHPPKKNSHNVEDINPLYKLERHKRRPTLKTEDELQRDGLLDNPLLLAEEAKIEPDSIPVPPTTSRQGDASTEFDAAIGLARAVVSSPPIRSPPNKRKKRSTPNRHSPKHVSHKQHSPKQKGRAAKISAKPGLFFD